MATDPEPYRDLHDPDPTGQHATAWAVQGIPADARRMGFDRNTVEGSWLALVGTLDGTKTRHRVVAWLLLAVLLGPMLLSIGAWLGLW